MALNQVCSFLYLSFLCWFGTNLNVKSICYSISSLLIFNINKKFKNDLSSWTIRNLSKISLKNLKFIVQFFFNVEFNKEEEEGICYFDHADDACHRML